MLLTKDYLPLHEIAAKFRRSPECVRLWITRGVLVDGVRHKLKASKIGGSWLVCEDDLFEFITDPLQKKGDEA